MTDEQIKHMVELFEGWWRRVGAGIDSDPSVPWSDKRKALAWEAFEAAFAMSRNYTADDPTQPEQFVFANGRVVTIGDDDTLKIGL